MPRRTRHIILGAGDFIILALAPWLAFSLRIGELFIPPSLQFYLLLMAPLPFLGVVALERAGVYRMVSRYIGTDGMRRIVVAVTLTTLVWALIVALTRTPVGFQRTSFLLFWMIASALLIASRLLWGFFAQRVELGKSFDSSSQKNALIYGAGSAGNELARELKSNEDYKIAGFVDDDSSLWNQKVDGIKVRSPDNLEHLIASLHVDEVLIALPSVSFQRRREILKKLKLFPVKVMSVPSVGDIVSGRMSFNDVQPISTDELLGRESVQTDQDLLKRNIKGKAILITGAGGSIGSELARQVITFQPSSIVLFELSEAALYQIEMELRESIAEKLQQHRTKNTPVLVTKIFSVLGSVLDDTIVRSTIKTHDIGTIFHAAAYKHVPIVELNPIVGVRNNVIGTQIVVEAAKDLGVERFILISTDKAVRPTNVMGASKRLAELVVQANASHNSNETIFSMVRFGNVLASSGSVIHRFNQQIKQGGPVTVTHRDIIRYFMSIPEAAQLVMAAGSMATGGEVFVLDMGEPVKINDLARQMIHLSGLRVFDGTDGDIAIKYTGLRPGEKLFEELLIGGETLPTDHAKILKCIENFHDYEELQLELKKLRRNLLNSDIQSLAKQMEHLVDGYMPSEQLRNSGKAPLSRRNDIAN